MKTLDEKAFLVFSGGNDRAVIGFLRALRLCGRHAFIIARTRADLVLQTSFRRDVCAVRPDHTLSLAVFAHCIAQVRAASRTTDMIVLPSTEYFNTFLLRHRAEIEHMGCEVPLVNAALYAQLTSKHSANEFFAAAGVAIPEEVHDVACAAPPIVAKPRINVSNYGKSLYPHLLTTAEALESFLRTESQADYFFQEYVDGDSVYLLFYVPRSGRGAVTWSQRNLAQQPGGKSMLLAEASRFHASPTAKQVLKALRTAGFYGLGMVEVIRTANRDVFIEMNPRIWGPVQFCVDQQQPILQAFIGDALHNDASYYLRRTPAHRRQYYFWAGGFAKTLSAGAVPTWHTARKALAAMLLRSIACDVYLRKDSWRCFVRELMEAFKMRRKRGQPKG